MNLVKQNRSFSLTILLTLLLLNVFVGKGVRAQEFDLNEAITWGLEHNSSLQGIKDNVNKIERDLKSIEAKSAWQVGINTNADYGKFKDDFLPFNKDEKEGSRLQIDLEASKSFLWGLDIRPELSLKETDPIDFANLEDKLDFSLHVKQKLYPKLLHPLEQEYDAVYTKLLEAKANLNWQRGSKEIDWLEGFLNLIRLQQRLELVRENIKLAQDNLDDVLRQKEINEAGEQQLLTAKINFKEAEYSLAQSKNNFTQQKQGWYQELSLSAVDQVNFTNNSSYLENIKAWVESLKLDLGELDGSMDSLMERIAANNPQLKANKLDQELIQKQLKWFQAEGKPEINLNGTYYYQSEDWSTGISVTYNLFDGGQRKLKDQDYQAQISGLKRDYQQLVKDLNLQLISYLNQIQLDELNIIEKKLKYEKTSLEENYLTKQFKEGLIRERKLKEKEIERKQTEIDLKIAQDKLLISNLRLIHFLGIKKEL